jgi:hypothetical protein
VKTTEVLIEHFVGGILIAAALFFVFWSFLQQPIEGGLSFMLDRLNRGPG